MCCPRNSNAVAELNLEVVSMDIVFLHSFSLIALDSFETQKNTNLSPRAERQQHHPWILHLKILGNERRFSHQHNFMSRALIY